MKNLTVYPAVARLVTNEGILEETNFTVTALNSTEAKNKVFEEILKDQQRIIHLEITNKRETR